MTVESGPAKKQLLLARVMVWMSRGILPSAPSISSGKESEKYWEE